MTTSTFRALCVLLSFCFYSQHSSAQLDSSFAEISFVPGELLPDSTAGPETAVLTLLFDDISDLGELNVVTYIASSGTPVLEYVKSRSELLSENLLLTDRVEWAFPELLPGTTYRIEVSPKNLAGAYTRICSVTFSL